MTHIIDMTGRQFGRLTVIEQAGRRPNGNATWRCQCTCGNTCVVDGHRLRVGETTSCGCLQREQSRRNLLANPATRKRMGDYHLLAKKWHPTTTELRSSNQSGITGVSFDKRRQKWIAHLYYKGRYVLNESFEDKADAIAARQAAERKYLA